MISKDLIPAAENAKNVYLSEIGSRADGCMKQHQPYLRKDFSMHHLALIINVPETDVQIYFDPSHRPFDGWLNKWRVIHAKSLMDNKKTWNLDIKSIASLSGFSSLKKFAEAFTRLENISPEDYQLQITKTLSI